ncbi:branched-chain amino acid ABC transporter permease [Phyllobacterium sp. SB3]|uniref:branched-chain amino acid ABC transporter permease n=1 Tax=Phyllobacterium sp. SB3 TaxID=3156073 RepID=UPI0032B00D00
MLLIIVNGLALGALYGMTAIVYNMQFSTSKVLSFGAGQYAMVGGVIGAYVTLHLGYPVWLGLLGSLASGAIFGWLSEFIAIRRIVRTSDDHLWILSTLAFATIVQQLTGIWWGTEPTPFPRVFEQGYAGVLDQKFWLPILTAVVMAGAIDIFYRKTMTGKVFLATAEDGLAARARGIGTDNVRAFSFALSGLIGAACGFSAGQLTFVNFALGSTLGLGGFVALAVGGIGSNAGGLIGGTLLGLLISFTSHFVGSQYQNTVAIGLLVLFLLFRPQGLFPKTFLRHV